MEQGECLGGDDVDVPRGPVEQGECLGEGGTDEPDVVDGGRRGPEEQGACHGAVDILKTQEERTDWQDIKS